MDEIKYTSICFGHYEILWKNWEIYDFSGGQILHAYICTKWKCLTYYKLYFDIFLLYRKKQEETKDWGL